MVKGIYYQKEFKKYKVIEKNIQTEPLVKQGLTLFKPYFKDIQTF